MQELDCDIACVLQNKDFTILQKLVSHCQNFRAKVAAKIDNATTYEIECAEKRNVNSNTISELQQEIERLKSEIDATKLEQKIIDKKILNAVKQQEDLKVEVDVAKSKRDNLSLEMVDLQQESEKRKEMKLLTWDAIKRACHIYKQNLDLHVHLEEDDGCKRAKISFFVFDETTKHKYYVHLLNSNNQWRVEQIQPTLTNEQLSELKGTVDFSKHSEISDVTAFLCLLRHIFLKYYIQEN